MSVYNFICFIFYLLFYRFEFKKKKVLRTLNSTELYKQHPGWYEPGHNNVYISPPLDITTASTLPKINHSSCIYKYKTK